MKLSNLDKHGNSTAADSSDRESVVDGEALSALLDGELSGFELRRLLKRLEEQPALLETWQRLSLGRSALQGQPFRRASRDFSGRVTQAVADQPSLNPPAMAPAGWLQTAGKLAVAASVTAAVFLGMQYTLMDNGNNGGNHELAGSSYDAPAGVDADAQRRLNEYIQSVSITARSDSQAPDFNFLLNSPQLRPVSDRELVSPD